MFSALLGVMWLAAPYIGIVALLFAATYVAERRCGE